MYEHKIVNVGTSRAVILSAEELDAIPYFDKVRIEQGKDAEGIYWLIRPKYKKVKP